MSFKPLSSFMSALTEGLDIKRRTKDKSRRGGFNMRNKVQVSWWSFIPLCVCVCVLHTLPLTHLSSHQTPTLRPGKAAAGQSNDKKFLNICAKAACTGTASVADSRWTRRALSCGGATFSQRDGCQSRALTPSPPLPVQDTTS